LRSPEGLDGLKGSLYRRPESVPTAAVDKNGELPFCSQGVHAMAGRVCQGEWMSSSCSRGELALWGGLGGVVHGRAGCGRPLAATADLTAAL